ncbi:MAG: hypothetical protein WC373_02160 [Smithella sp.]
MKNAQPRAKHLHRIKEIDSASLASFLKAHCYCIIALSVPAMLIGGLMGLLIAVLLSIPLAVLVYLIARKIGDFAGRLFGVGRKPAWTIKERFQGEIEQAMFFKRQQQYYRALKKVNGILKQAPEFAEALFLKAQILWEGYNTANGAKRYLDMASKCVLAQEHLHCWIKSYQEKIDYESAAQHTNQEQKKYQKIGGGAYYW